MSEYMMGPYELAAYRAGEPIRDIVRRGQHTLVRIYLAGKHQERLDYSAKALKQVSHTVDMCPPRTLGELGLEWHEDLLRSAELAGVVWWGAFDTHSVRRAMFSRNRGGTQ